MKSAPGGALTPPGLAQEGGLPMHDQRNPQDEKPCAHNQSTADEDRSTQAALLCVLLDAYPAQLSIDGVIRELTLDPENFGERDSIQRAIRDLGQAGLSHRQGRFVMPTHAAVRCSILLEG